MKHSSIPVSSELREAIQNAELAAQAFKDAGLAERAAKLDEHIANARGLRFSIGIVAQAKRGKSTLINGLLGRKDDMLAPIDRFPATNVVSCFANGSRENARIFFQGDDEKAPGKTVQIEEIRQYACEEHNPDNRKGVKGIEVVGDFPLLGEDVVLVDTPGADNALTRVHDLVLMECLPKLDAVVFLVTADAPLVASEVELLKLIRKNDVRKLLFAMNKVDAVQTGDMTAEELAEGFQHNRKFLAEAGFGDAPVFEISAKNFHETGEDPGTERLIETLGDTIASGRAALIAERLTAIIISHVAEAAAEVETAIANSELTLEQITEQRAKLEEMRRNLDRNREAMELKFRTVWRSAFDQFEDTLAPLQRQLVNEYTDFVESTPAYKLNELGGMIHTDVIKRLDELLQPHSDELSSSIASATTSLQVDVLGSMGIEPREATQLITRKQTLTDTVGNALAGAPSLAGAAIVGTMPGLIGSAIMSAAPGVVVATWNPFTWIAAAASGAASAAVTTTAAAVTGILAPFAAVGAPLLIGYAGLRVYSSWKYKVGQTKNELSIAVKDLIIGSVEETRRNLRRARAKDDGILEEFRGMTAAKIGGVGKQLEDLEKNRPSPERIVELKAASRLIENLKEPERLPDREAPTSDGKRLFT